MSLHLSDKWIWDFWFANDGNGFHVFYLQAPKSIGDPEQRHWQVSIGHAISQDLHHWDLLPDAIQPGKSSEWDNYTTWTGSIIQHQEFWYLFYTGTNRKENGLVQRIGVATSQDLIRWEKYSGNPVMEVDTRWYEQLDTTIWHDQAWRDPFIIQHPETGDYHALITARVNSGPRDERGVIAHARSDNLLEWEVLPPITNPGLFGQLEVPQVVKIKEKYYLLFSTQDWAYSEQYKKQLKSQPVTGVHYLMADNPLGPFPNESEQLLIGDKSGKLYSGKIVRNAKKEWVFLAFRNYDKNGEFFGDLIDPIAVQVERDGTLRLKH